MVLFTVLINGFTWPLATYTYHTFAIHIGVVETSVILMEALVLKLWWRHSWFQAIVLSTLANVASYTAGVLYYS